MPFLRSSSPSGLPDDSQQNLGETQRIYCAAAFFFTIIHR